MLTLYQLSISHYCEKIRWALAHKRLDHQAVSLLPGLHVARMKKLGLKSALPVLRDGDTLVQNSSDIVTYLDTAYPDRSLTPAVREDADEAIAWEAFADQHIGPHVRRICYHHLLEYPDVVAPLLAHGGPWYGRFALRLVFPKLRELMRKGMRIGEDEVALSRRALDEALVKVNGEARTGRFLVGDGFSRADLAVAALLAPLRMPAKYGSPWPQTLPPPLSAVVDEYADRLTWVDWLYQEHR